ncbi:hypothetical protein CYY_009203 [Polysphondylium violaceum]|uniref:Uncharacterized protein n=1 Tax=Polysphondylium violaceum TaxID=133409 RepID=A0A8J4UPN7_9MYCE|nr:hypothetical protein CYY_009203 [Polysphondylium violaceum]
MMSSNNKQTDGTRQGPGGSGGEFRRIPATGPSATKGTYNATIDPGLQLPSSSAGSPEDFYSAPQDQPK